MGGLDWARTLLGLHSSMAPPLGWLEMTKMRVGLHSAGAGTLQTEKEGEEHVLLLNQHFHLLPEPKKTGSEAVKFTKNRVKIGFGSSRIVCIQLYKKAKTPSFFKIT